MKTKLFLSLATVFALATAALAADEVTIKGKGLCAKCELHETDTCQTAIVVDKDGAKTTYYVAPNAASKKFHKTVCTDTVDNVTATGMVAEKDGKKVITVSKIEVAK
jgi:hypothetical protein